MSTQYKQFDWKPIFERRFTISEIPKPKNLQGLSLDTEHSDDNDV